MITQQFLEALYPKDAPTQGFLSLWELPGKSSKHVDTSAPDWREVAARIAGEWDAAGKNVFYGVCLRGTDLGQAKRGTKKDIVCVPGLWVDIDLAVEGHAAKNLPTSVADVVTKILNPFGVDPTLVVHSGGGLHVYWLFSAPMILTSENRDKVTNLSKDWQGLLGEIAKAAGYHLDMTADLSRVLRPAGTHNRKLSEPRPVSVLLNQSGR